jgi:hypothetical protein
MTEKQTYDITRRTVLAGLGTVGVAAAGAGLGTTALFNDREGFVGNSLAAGQLDLKLDYKATYDGPNGLEMIGQAPTQEELEAQGLIGMAEGPMTWEERADLGFACDTEGFIDGDEIPIFALDDVKPGDCGEVTVSLHICDNPAYLWMRGSVYDDLDNGLTEPEGEVDDTPDVGELAENIDVTLWYDEDCSNTITEGVGTSDILVVQDISGSMEYDQYGGVISDGSGGTTTKLAVSKDAMGDFATIVFDETADTEIGVFTFGNEDYIGDDQAPGVAFGPSAVEADVQTAISNVQAVPDDVTGTALGLAVQEGDSYLSANARSGAQKIMILLTDGEQFESNVDELQAANDAKAGGTRIIVIDINDPGDGQPQLLKDMAGTAVNNPGDGDGTDYYNSSADDLATVLPIIYSSIIESVVVGEVVFFEGTLAELNDAASSGFKLEALPLLGQANGDDEYCFLPGTHCVAMEWCIPVEVGNEIQTDSVKFDLDFAAVQCRHNGENANPFDNGSNGSVA